MKFQVKRKLKDQVKVSASQKNVPQGYGTITNVKFDAVSKLHLFTTTCIEDAFRLIGETPPRTVFSSLPKLSSKISTKRSVLGLVRSKIVRDHEILP